MLPADFRAELADGCVITKGQEHCLYVYPLERWNEEVERLKRLPRTNRTVRNYLRAAFAATKVETLDKQGRILIPEPLREYAGLEKDLTINGMSDFIEIWDVDAWKAISEEADRDYSGIEEEFGIEGL